MAQKFGSRDLINNAQMNSSFMSEPINLVQKKGFSIQCLFAGAPVGAFYIMVSIDFINWTMLPDSSIAITEAGDHFYNVNDVNYVAARLHYAFTSGNGVLNASYSTKEIV